MPTRILFCGNCKNGFPESKGKWVTYPLGFSRKAIIVEEIPDDFVETWFCNSCIPPTTPNKAVSIGGTSIVE